MGTSHQRGYVTPRGKQWYGYFRKVGNDPVDTHASIMPGDAASRWHTAIDQEVERMAHPVTIVLVDSRTASTLAQVLPLLLLTLVVEVRRTQ